MAPEGATPTLTKDLAINGGRNVTARIVALCNQKGGVGKSTTAFQLARAAVRAGRTVLLVDNDPQGNLTAVATQNEVSPDQVGLADVLSARTHERISDVIVQGVWPQLDVVPTTGPTLGGVRDEITTAQIGRETRLRDALREVQDRYDLILIDCAPSLDQLTINALAASDGVLVVTHSKQWSLNGLAQLLETIESVRGHYNQHLRVAGVLVNHHEERTISGQTWIEELRAAGEARSLRVLEPPIPKRVVIADATEAARGLDEWGSGEATELSALYSDYLATIEGELA